MTKEEARGLAAQAWCTDKTSSTVMDTDLAEAFADILIRETDEALETKSWFGTDIQSRLEATEKKLRVALEKIEKTRSQPMMDGSNVHVDNERIRGLAREALAAIEWSEEK